MTEEPERPDEETFDEAAAREAADLLVARVDKLPERRMRVVYFCERIAAMDPREAVEVLRAVIDRAGERRPGALAILADLGEGDPINELIDAGTLSHLYHGARRLEYDDVVRLLSRPRAAKEYGQEDDTASMYAIKDKTIGERRYLARSRDRDVLDRLTYDLDPLVVRVLLDNPLITEKDVLKIAARRPATPELLAEVARHPRWVARQRVREAIVRNPYVDTHLALSLVPTMLRAQLKQVAADTEVHDDVRRMARRVLRKKPPSKEDGKPT